MDSGSTGQVPCSSYIALSVLIPGESKNKNKNKQTNKKPQSLDGDYILRTKDILKTYCPFLGRSCIYLYNGERIGVRGEFNKFAVRWMSVFNALVIWHMCRSTQLMNILKVWRQRQESQNQASCGHPLPWSQGKNTQASLPGGHTWRGCPFVQHGKEVGWQNQTRQEEPGRQPPSRKIAQCLILSVFPFSRSKRLETTIASSFRCFHQLSRSTDVPTYNCIGHLLLP